MTTRKVRLVLDIEYDPTAVTDTGRDLGDPQNWNWQVLANVGVPVRNHCNVEVVGAVDPADDYLGA
jgi:hypothetical protein